MARTKKPPVSLQESVLTALAFDDKYGAEIAMQVGPQYFDEDYRPLAEMLLNYRSQHKKAPGLAHLDDMIDSADLAKAVMETAQHQVAGMVTQFEQGFNAKYVADKAEQFVHRQVLKTAVLQASDRYEQGGSSMEEEVEQILYAALRHKHVAADPGLFLNDPRGLEFLSKEEAGYSLGIPELDYYGVTLKPGTMTLYIAAKGTGKSWSCVHVGRHTRMQRAKVCHITLEMSEQEVYERYMQNLFGAARTGKQLQKQLMEFDPDGQLTAIKTRKFRPKLNFENPQVRSILTDKIKQWGLRLGGLVVKRFPTGGLTISQLNAYLDMLDSLHNFIPQVLIVDYPDLMKTDANNYRHSLGGVYEGLRGVAVERNMALYCPTQGNRGTMRARNVYSSDVAEDKRKVDASDNVLTFSQTEEEKQLGLARLRVEHARNTEGGFTTLLAQNYPTGQYVMQSHLMVPGYWDTLKRKTGKDVEEEDDDD